MSLIVLFQPDILVLTETWLKDYVPNSAVSISGSNIFRIDRVGRGGGVAILTRPFYLLLLYCMCHNQTQIALKIQLGPRNSVSVAGVCKTPFRR